MLLGLLPASMQVKADVRLTPGTAGNKTVVLVTLSAWRRPAAFPGRFSPLFPAPFPAPFPA